MVCYFNSLNVCIHAALTLQSLGLFVGAAMNDFQRSLVVAVVVFLSSMLLGGYYVQRLSSWIDWTKYASFITYSFDLALQFEFTSDLVLDCNPSELSSYSSCNGTDAGVNSTISGLEVLEQNRVTMVPMYANFIALIVLLLLSRFLAYLSLRFLHRKH